METSSHTRTGRHAEDGLRRRWVELGVDLGVAAGAPAARWAQEAGQLLAAYGAPGRVYHGVAHLAAVLVTLDELWPHPDRPVPPSARAAAWFHDAIYEPTRADNEARSAAWARAVLEASGVGRPTVAVAVGLVEATAAHRLVGPLQGTPGAASFLDADLAILGARPEAYDRYGMAIRAEYRHLDDDTFRAGRAEVLADLGARPRLFLSGRGRARFEAAARTNLARELASLEAPPGREVEAPIPSGPAGRQGAVSGDAAAGRPCEGA